MVQGLQRLAAVGWAMGTASVRDYLATRASEPQSAGGAFAAEAQRLGLAVVRKHLDLAEALGVELAGASRLVAAMLNRLDQALGEVPELRRYDSGLRARYDKVLDEVRQVRLQHVHADLHLGQVLRTPRNLGLDRLRGHPRRTNRANACPARHRMLAEVLALRRHAIAGGTSRERWVVHPRDGMLRRNWAAFCCGYAEVAKDPYQDAALLRAIELDRAVFEVRHEHRHRPEWAVIPLSYISEVVTGGPLL